MFERAEGIYEIRLHNQDLGVSEVKIFLIPGKPGERSLMIDTGFGNEECFGRLKKGMEEVRQSFELIRRLVSMIPEGPIRVPVKGNPNGEYFMRIEQPRGEAIYYVKGSGTKFLDRFRLRTPTTSNIPPMLEMLKGCQLADVPLLILTIDPCISCTER